jgi:hypothetical protein
MGWPTREQEFHRSGRTAVRAPQTVEWGGPPSGGSRGTSPDVQPRRGKEPTAPVHVAGIRPPAGRPHERRSRPWSRAGWRRAAASRTATPDQTMDIARHALPRGSRRAKSEGVCLKQFGDVWRRISAKRPSALFRRYRDKVVLPTPGTTRGALTCRGRADHGSHACRWDRKRHGIET